MKLGIALIIVGVTVSLFTSLVMLSRVNERCSLLAIAYNEQDELAGLWYVNTAEALQQCGYKLTKSDDPQKRGRDANGNYNRDK